MTKSISASVGKKGANRPNDVKTVQELLNKVPITSGRPTPLLEVDGMCWSLTCTAIGNFQKISCGFKWPDQLISVGGRTWNQLIALTGGATGLDTNDEDVISIPPISAMFPRYGVDSYINANNDQYTSGNRKFYDAVYDKLQTPISFWGRYIGASNSLTPDEVNYLHHPDRNCKILVIYNGNSATSVTRVKSVTKPGENPAQEDISRTKTAASWIPLKVTIYANIDSNMNPSVDWLMGWLTGMVQWRNSAGIYMGLSIANNYCEALRRLPPDIKQKTFLMLGKNVSAPHCHLGGAHVKQDIQNQKIFHIKGGNDECGKGWACVDVDSASDIGMGTMW
nr:hypothetical protein [uncultured Desulfobacter sp.]